MHFPYWTLKVFLSDSGIVVLMTVLIHRTFVLFAVLTDIFSFSVSFSS